MLYSSPDKTLLLTTIPFSGIFHALSLFISGLKNFSKFTNTPGSGVIKVKDHFTRVLKISICKIINTSFHPYNKLLCIERKFFKIKRLSKKTNSFSVLESLINYYQ